MEKESIGKEMLEWIKSIVIAVLIAFLIKRFLFYSVLVDGASMEPSLHNGDRLFTNKIPLYYNGLQHGDVISFKAPDAIDKNYIKRVIGLAGDTIEIKDGKVYRNGQELVERYIAPDSYTDIYMESEWTVGEGEIFVLGDNRLPGASNDSRFFGPIKENTIGGISDFRYYPFDKNFGRLDK